MGIGLHWVVVSREGKTRVLLLPFDLSLWFTIVSGPPDEKGYPESSLAKATWYHPGRCYQGPEILLFQALRRDFQLSGFYCNPTLFVIYYLTV